MDFDITVQNGESKQHKSPTNHWFESFAIVFHERDLVDAFRLSVCDNGCKWAASTISLNSSYVFDDLTARNFASFRKSYNWLDRLRFRQNCSTCEISSFVIWCRFKRAHNCLSFILSLVRCVLFRTARCEYNWFGSNPWCVDIMLPCQQL